MEKTILSNLIYNDEYSRKVVPFLKDEYFSETAEKIAYQLITDYFVKYNSVPTKEALYINLSDMENINEHTFEEVKGLFGELNHEKGTSNDWLIQKTEEFCKEKAVYNAIHKSIEMLDDKQNTGKIPSILSEALAVSFDTHIGHDFIEDAAERYDSYHEKEKKIPFAIDILNQITDGGSSTKTLSCLMASTGVGKSLTMCSMAAFNLMCNYNVLYITLEMSEKRIARRIDANLLDMDIKDLKYIGKVEYEKKMKKIREKSKGRLIIKEYPTTSANVTHFRHLLNELRIKKNFVPDIVYVDYINICSSARMKLGATGSYGYIKAIAEELRGLAQEFDIPIWTATQANRSALGSSDMGLENTSDSMGLPMTLDFMIAALTSDELEEMGVILMKQLKNRDGDASKWKKFFVGIDRAKMKLFNADDSLQDGIYDANKPEEDKPVMDNTDFGLEDEERGKKPKKFDRSKFKGFS